MEWQLNPFAGIMLVSAITAAMVSLNALRKRRRTPPSYPFALMMAFISLWSLGYAVELSGAGFESLYLGVRMAYPGIAAVPVLYFLFAARYAELERPFAVTTIFALFIIPVITLTLNWTSHRHELYYESAALEFSGPNILLTVTPGPWYWVHTFYSYACLLAGTAVLAWKSFGSHSLYRQQIALILGGMTVPWLGNILDIFVRPVEQVNLGPLSFVVMGILFSLALFRKGLLEIIPVARDKIIESMSDGMAVIDGSGRIVDINDVMLSLTGLKHREIIGMTAREAFVSHPSLERALRAGDQGEQDITVTHGADERHYSLRMTCLSGRTGSFLGTLAILRDITKRIAAERKLQSAHEKLMEKTRVIESMNRTLKDQVDEAVRTIREKEELLTLQGRYASMGELIDFVAHQWKQNLYAANLWIEAMKNRAVAGVAIDTADIESMDAQLRNMNSTLAEFRNFVDPGRGETELFTVKEAVEAALSLIGDMLMVGGISVRHDFREDIAVTGHRNELSQVVLNMVNNARQIFEIRNTPDPEITISIYRNGNDGVLEIGDNGGGIDEESLPLVFDKFFTKTSGTGLGLYISRMIIEQHFNGTITAESSGGRTIFTVRLPLPRRKDCSQVRKR